MTDPRTILLLEDEAFVLVGLEMAAEDRGHTLLSALSEVEALRLIEQNSDIDVAVLDVNLGGGATCDRVAAALGRRAIPFLLHSGNLDREDEAIRKFGAPLVAKPAAPDLVIERALDLCHLAG